MTLIVNVVNGEVMHVVDTGWCTAAKIAGMFPFGEVYIQVEENQAIQWRVLQRPTRDSDKHSYFAQLLPIKVEQLPEIVQVVHTCTN